MTTRLNSSAPVTDITSILALMGLFAVAGATDDTGNKAISAVPPPPPVASPPVVAPPAISPPVPPVTAKMAGAQAFGALFVPPSWSRSVFSGLSQSPSVSVNTQRPRLVGGIPVLPAVPVATATAKRRKADGEPHYGTPIPRVMSRPPSGG